MRRRLLIFAALPVLLAACGAVNTVAPLPETVEGRIPKAPQVTGDPVAGKALFAAQGCGACHTFQPAGSNGKVGPNLDNVRADAAKANRGPLADYVHESLVDPNAYVVPGFAQGVMPSFSALTPKQLADLVAFVTKSS
jgi:cytochrome c